MEKILHLQAHGETADLEFFPSLPRILLLIIHLFFFSPLSFPGLLDLSRFDLGANEGKNPCPCLPIINSYFDECLRVIICPRGGGGGGGLVAFFLVQLFYNYLPGGDGFFFTFSCWAENFFFFLGRRSGWID